MAERRGHNVSRLKNFWHLLNLPCEGMTQIASDSLDRELGLVDRLALKSHLIYCVGCRRFLIQIKFVRAAVKKLPRQFESKDPFTGPCLPDAMRERIKQALADDTRSSD